MELGSTRIFTGKKAIFQMRAIGIIGPGELNRRQLLSLKKNGERLPLISFPEDNDPPT